MADLALFYYGGTSAKDGAVEMLGCWEGVLECFDTIIRVRLVSDGTYCI